MNNGDCAEHARAHTVFLFAYMPSKFLWRCSCQIITHSAHARTQNKHVQGEEDREMDRERATFFADFSSKFVRCCSYHVDGSFRLRYPNIFFVMLLLHKLQVNTSANTRMHTHTETQMKRHRERKRVGVAKERQRKSCNIHSSRARRCILSLSISLLQCFDDLFLSTQ